MLVLLTIVCVCVSMCVSLCVFLHICTHTYVCCLREKTLFIYLEYYCGCLVDDDGIMKKLAQKIMWFLV